MPELRHLRAFVAVAEELNFTRAARKLHLAQQAVSKSVAQLEAELGVELLKRTTHDVGLTRAGAALLTSGCDALAAVDVAFDQARMLGRGLAGTVRVGATPAIGAAVRSEVAAVLRDGAPDVSVAFHEVRPAEVAQVLRERSVDVVLARTSRPAPEVEGTALRPTEASLFVPSGHRLADQRSVPIAELDFERLLTWSAPGTPYTDLTVAQLQAAGAHVETVQARVTGGDGPPDLLNTGTVALLPRGWPTGTSLVEVALEEAPTLPLLLLWSTGARTPVVDKISNAMAVHG